MTFKSAIENGTGIGRPIFTEEHQNKNVIHRGLLFFLPA